MEVLRPSKLWNLQLIPVVLKNRFDLVYCSNDYWGFFTYFALAKLLPCKVIFEAHGILSLERTLSLVHTPTNKVSFKMLRWREKFVIKHADCIIALAEDISRYYGSLNKCIFIVDNFLDEKQFKPQKSSRKRMLDKSKKKCWLNWSIRLENRHINNYFLDFVYQNIDQI